MDVGGTSVKTGLVDVGLCRAVDVRSRPVDAAGAAGVVLDQLGDAARSALAADDTTGVAPLADRLAVAFPAPFDYRAGTPLIKGQRKFDAIFGVDLVDEFRQRCGRPGLDVRFCNDADAGAWGEARCGAGRDRTRFLMVTLGTGFGGSLVDRATASRPGMDEGPAARLYERPVDDLGRADDVLSGFGLAAAVGVTPAALPAACRSARSGVDREQVRLPFERYGRLLGRFLTEVAADLEVDDVVIGGGAGQAFDLFAPSLRQAFAGRVAKAELGSAAALLGAATLFD